MTIIKRGGSVLEILKLSIIIIKYGLMENWNDYIGLYILFYHQIPLTKLGVIDHINKK